LRWIGKCEPSVPSRATLRGMRMGCFLSCPGVGGVLWEALMEKVRAAASYCVLSFT